MKTNIIGRDSEYGRPGPVTAKLSAQLPTMEDVTKIASQVELEMVGQPLNRETAYRFVNTVRERVSQLIVIEVV
ncbi:hypothetical protein [Enterobacter asburiae]|uniref:hypothetical protein n=1 Tax=Enterobacter asburiae TaxID=61645 RepID=UPI0020753A09|nr:hypothetical protein [Enterobacter asburiae]MCM7880593.1 hypothetical protein [Enterobacter asburiae]